MRVATQMAATDPRTGTIDMDMISTGRTQIDRDMVLKLADSLREIQAVLKSMGSGTDGRGGSVSISEIEGAVRELENEDLVQYLEKTQTVIIRG
eukprot:gene34897-45162_t